MAQRPIAVKKPAGGRPVPKRLFSFDSLRKEKSTSGNSSGSEAEQGSQNGGALKLVEKPNGREALMALQRDRSSRCLSRLKCTLRCV